MIYNNNNNKQNQCPLDLATLQLAEELQKPIIRKFKKRKVYSGFEDNISGADLANMQLISKFNKGFRFLLCVIGIFSKYAWVIPLKDKKGASIAGAFQKILKESDRGPNEIWVDKGSEFYNNSFKKSLKDNNIGMYSIHNEGKSVAAERFIGTLKNKIYKYMTSISKDLYINKLDDIVDEYNNTYHRTIKMKFIDVKDNTYIDFGKKVNDKDPKFNIGDHVRITKYTNIFPKGYTPNWSKEVFVISKTKNRLPWTYVINDPNSEEITGNVYEKELQKPNRKEFRVGKVIKIKGDKLYVKWKGYDNSFNSWIGKKDLVWFYRFQLHCIKISQYFPKTFEPFGGNINVKVDLSNYATKADIKNISHIDTSNLANLKTKVDKLDIDKLKPLPDDVSKLSNVVANQVIKKTDYKI